MGKTVIRWFVGVALVTLLTTGLFWLTQIDYGECDWTGFSECRRATGSNEEFRFGKTLWDWMDLLIVPAVLAVGAFVFNRTEKRNEQSTAQQRADDGVLQGYLDKMTDLLVASNSKDNKLEMSDIQGAVTARTLTTLSLLKGDRKVAVLRFLRESNLVTAGAPLISLEGADLSRLNLREMNLTKIDLRRTDLRGTDLTVADLTDVHLHEAKLAGTILAGAKLQGAQLPNTDLRKTELRFANLKGANLIGANLIEVDLNGTYLDGASLEGADLRGADLSGVRYGAGGWAFLPPTEPTAVRLTEAKYNDRTRWPSGFAPERSAAVLVIEQDGSETYVLPRTD